MASINGITYRCFAIMMAVSQPRLGWRIRHLIWMGAQRVINWSIVHIKTKLNRYLPVSVAFLCCLDDSSGVV